MLTSSQHKHQRLQAHLAQLDRCLIAFSAGVDSTFLLKVAVEILGRARALAVTACSPSLAIEEAQAASTLARQIGAQLIWLETEELANPNYQANTPQRCYFCKHALFAGMAFLARQLDIRTLLYGAILDDLQDVRPGQRAAEEFHVQAPLQEVGLTKAEIRALSRQLGLATWDKPQLACLASRIPHGLEVTEERLHRVEHAERLVRAAGFVQVRVRHHATLARIEVEPADIPRLRALLADGGLTRQLQALGFAEVHCDPHGYRSAGRTPQVVTR